METVENYIYEGRNLFTEADSNPMFHLYRVLTGHPYNILIPFFLSVILSFLAMRIMRNFFKKNDWRFFWRYALANFIYILLMIVVIFVIALLVDHLSLFWFIGLIFYGMQVTLPLWIIWTLVLSRGQLKSENIDSFRKLPRAGRWIMTVFATAVLGISFYASFVEPFQIEVTYHNFQFENEDLNLRIVHLSDIQTDVLGRREKEVVEIVRELKPDIIVITGDYFNGGKSTHPYGFASARYVLENLSAPMGIFAVSSDSNLLSDHEPLFEGLPITYLENKWSKIVIDGQELYIVGVSRREPDTRLAWDGVPDDASKLLIYHGPEIYFDPQTSKYAPELILVGHTHGGQISLPFIGSLTSGTPYGREYASGWFHKDNMSMYVNRGIGLEGWWAPKIRFLTRPEIAVIDIGK